MAHLNNVKTKQKKDSNEPMFSDKLNLPGPTFSCVFCDTLKSL